METEENEHNTQLENVVQTGKFRRRAIDQMAIGSIILLWGGLLALKQAGIIDKSVSTWPFPLTGFGILLIAGGIYRLRRSRHLSKQLEGATEAAWG